MNSNEFNNQKKNLFASLGLSKRLITIAQSMRSLLISLKNPEVFFFKLYAFFIQFRSRRLSLNCNFIYDNDVIDLLISSGKSFIRIGDGEIYHIIHRSLDRKDDGFQARNKRLSDDLKLIIDDYSFKSNYYLGLNLTMLRFSNIQVLISGLISIIYIQRFYFVKYIAYKKYNLFLDALIFRHEASATNLEISKLWRNKHVVLIHPSIDKFNEFKTVHEDSSYIQVPIKNAYSKIDEIYTSCLVYNSEDLVFLVSAGPSAKVLCYKLIKKQFTCYDMGHYFDLKFNPRDFTYPPKVI